MRRVFDLTMAAAALLVLSPLMAVIAAVVRLLLGRPVLFRQQRPGLHGRPFTLVKFRSMAGGRETSTDAGRLTPLGRWLRATSLDELPQLWNVVRGEMSLVGPRPLLVRYLDRYTPEQARRHEVRPGLTGWAQVNGRNARTWEERFALDVWYVDHRSWRLDLGILVRTAWKVLTREGIAAEGEATMAEFLGTSGAAAGRQGAGESVCCVGASRGRSFGE